MKVLYYTSAPFLDIALEKTNILKNDVDLHLLMEITPGNSKRVGIDELPDDIIISCFSKQLKVDSYNYLESYIKGCGSSNFFIHKSKTGFSFSTIKASFQLWLFIKKLNPDIIHLEVISLRSLGLFPFLFSGKKIFLTLHDSIPHKGENDWKIFLPRFLLLKLPYSRSYFFYSEFSKLQFEQYYKKDKHPKFLLKMYPYSYYRRFNKQKETKSKHILFFGAIAPYKGVEDLLMAMPYVLKNFPSETLLIAGCLREGFYLPQEIIDKYTEQIIVLNRYIPNEELVKLIQDSKFVVCPYIDATQSGVLMTAFALNKPVIATNVGAFPEYIEQGVTGMIVPPSAPEKLANAIISALENNYYELMGENIANQNQISLWYNNNPIVLNVYNT